MYYLICGAGLTGCVLAERLAQNKNNQIILIDRKRHIGGACFDEYNTDGILIQKYGPHIFNTASREVWNYVNEFTEFIEYYHRVKGYVDGTLVPIPFNLISIQRIFPEAFAGKVTEKLLNKYGYNTKVPILEIGQQEDPDLQFLADFVYEKVFLHYTEKQWGQKPDKIGGRAMARIPVFISTDDRYFQNQFQGIPKYGYTRMMEKMISAENISVMLGMDVKKLIRLDESTHEILVDGKKFEGRLIYTGCLDELFDFRFGTLPYRTLSFEFETLPQESFQEVATVNYPNNYSYTRITEFKKLTMQVHPFTTIMREYPGEYQSGDLTHDPLYPIPTDENDALYRKYCEEAQQYKNLIPAGRLGNYRYFTMAETIENALRIFDRVN